MNTTTSNIEIIEHTRPGQYIDILAYKVKKALGGEVHKSGSIYLKKELYKKLQNNITENTNKFQLYYIQLNYEDAYQIALILNKESNTEILGTRVINNLNGKKSKYKFRNKKNNELIKKILSKVSVNIHQNEY